MASMRGTRLFVKEGGGPVDPTGLLDTVGQMTEDMGPSEREIGEALEKAEASFEVLRRAGLPDFEIEKFKESVALVAPQTLAMTLKKGNATGQLSRTTRNHDGQKNDDPWNGSEIDEDDEEESENTGGFKINPNDMYIRGTVERLQMGHGGFSSVWKRRWTVVTKGALYCFGTELRPGPEEGPEFQVRLASHVTQLSDATFAFKERFDREHCLTVESTGRGRTQKGKARRTVTLAFKDPGTLANWRACLERATVPFDLAPPKPSLFKACQRIDLVSINDILLAENATELINEQNMYKCTALHYAVKAACNTAKDAKKTNEITPDLEKSLMVVALLMAHGANPHIKDNLGRTCFEIVELTVVGLPRTKKIILDLLKSSKYEFDGEGTVYIFPADFDKLKRRVAGHVTEEGAELAPPSVRRAGGVTFQLRRSGGGGEAGQKGGAAAAAAGARGAAARVDAALVAHTLQATMGRRAAGARAAAHGPRAPGFPASLYPHQKLPTAAQTLKTAGVRDTRDPLAAFYRGMARETAAGGASPIKTKRRSRTAPNAQMHGTTLGRETGRRRRPAALAAAPGPRPGPAGRPRTVQGGGGGGFPALRSGGGAGAGAGRRADWDQTWGSTGLLRAAPRTDGEFRSLTPPAPGGGGGGGGGWGAEDGFRPGTAPSRGSGSVMAGGRNDDTRMNKTFSAAFHEATDLLPFGVSKSRPPISNGEANRVISYWRATTGVPRPVKEVLERTVELNERSDFVAFSGEAELLDAFRVLTADPGSELVPVATLKNFLTRVSEILTEEEAEDLIEEADPTQSGFVNYKRFIKHMRVSRLRPLPQGRLFFPDDDPVHRLRRRQQQQAQAAAATAEGQEGGAAGGVGPGGEAVGRGGRRGTASEAPAPAILFRAQFQGKHV